MSQRPRVVLTAEDPDFDPVTIQHWKDEGFEVSYLPLDTTSAATCKAYIQQLQHLADPLELGEKYALVGQTKPFKRENSMPSNAFTKVSGFSLSRLWMLIRIWWRV